jgi:hypothetical protein
MDEFKGLITFKDRITYCDNNLKKISSGSGRIVYMIDDIKVLKLSKNSKGLLKLKLNQNGVKIVIFQIY